MSQYFGFNVEIGQLKSKLIIQLDQIESGQGKGPFSFEFALAIPPPIAIAAGIVLGRRQSAPTASAAPLVSGHQRIR